MPKIITVFIALIIAAQTSTGQGTFQRSFGGASEENCYSLQKTTDGGYIISGFTSSFGVDTSDVYVIKTDSNGDTLWTKVYGGAAVEGGNAIRETFDGGFIIGGRTQSFGAGSEDFYLIKTDGQGNLQWSSTYGESQFDWCSNVIQTSDSGYLLVGFTGTSTYDAYWVKTDDNGNEQWHRKFGGNDWEWTNAVIQTNDGGFLGLGATRSFGQGNADFYLLKTDGNGDTLWSKVYGGGGYDEGYDVLQTTDLGYLMLGASNSFGAGMMDLYLIRTDVTGAVAWAKTYGGTENDYGYSLIETSDNGYLLCGITKSFGAGEWDVYLIKTDQSGDTLWTRAYGGSNEDFAYAAVEATSGYTIAGFTKSFGVGDFDLYMIRTDSTGTVGCYEQNTSTIVATAAALNGPGGGVVTTGLITNSASTVEGLANTIVKDPCDSTSGVWSMQTEPKISLHPNPSRGILTMTTNFDIGTALISIRTVMGEKITEFRTSKPQTIIDLSGAAAGVYFITIQHKQSIYIRKIVLN